MLENSNLFNKKVSSNIISKDFSDTSIFKELLKSLESFSEVTYCQELVYDVVDEQSLMESLVYIWQQNSKRFNNNIPSNLKEFFVSKFTVCDDVYYKGLHSIKGNKLDPSSFEDLYFTSCTPSKDIAAGFAVGFKNYFFDNGEECCVYEVTGDLVLKNVCDYRDMGEEEVIIYNPVYSKKPVFKILESNYRGVDRLPSLKDMKIIE